MFAVAIAELAGSAEAEAPALATDLGCTAYDARLLLAQGMPAIVKTVAERDAALGLLAPLRGRGHGAIAFDLGAVVASGAMTSMRHLRLQDDAITLDDAPAERLPYADVLALVAAVHRRRTDTETISREKKFSMGRALLTSGLSMTKTVTTGSRSATEEKEGVVYVFRRDGATPWILHEHGTVWAGHGRPVAATASENYRLTVGLLRERASDAIYDDRLVTRRVSERTSVSGGMGSTSVTSSSEAGVDVLAHALATWFARLRAR